MIKLIATDLDGTLLLPDHVSVSEENVKALKAASEQDIKIVIASGRTHEVFPAGIRSIPFIDYALMSNGSSLMAFDSATGEPISHSPVTEMPYDLWTSAFDIIDAAGAHPEIYAFGRSFMDESRRDHFASPIIAPALVAELKSHVTFVDDVKETLRGRSIEKICVLAVPDETRETMTNALLADQRLEITTSIPGNVEVNLHGTGKGKALAMLCDALDITPDEVMALGDAGNDIDMLNFAGYSVAMANATDEAKAASKYITASNVEHGVAEAIYKYALESK